MKSSPPRPLKTEGAIGVMMGIGMAMRRRITIMFGTNILGIDGHTELDRFIIMEQPKEIDTTMIIAGLGREAVHTETSMNLSVVEASRTTECVRREITIAHFTLDIRPIIPPNLTWMIYG